MRILRYREQEEKGAMLEFVKVDNYGKSICIECDDAGVPLPDQRERYEQISSDPTYRYTGIIKYSRIHRIPRLIRCGCARRIRLLDGINYCDCGRIYELSGTSCIERTYAYPANPASAETGHGM